MSTWPDLAHRSEVHELMDDLTIGGAELEEALAQLRWINRLLQGAWPLQEGVKRLWQQAGQPTRLTILDVGAGSGDVNQPLLAWATRCGIDLRITLLDINPETCAAAATYYRNEPRIRVEQGDIFALPPDTADIVTASLIVHHFPTAQLPAVFTRMLQAARLGVVVNDLHRHPFAWACIWGATRLLSRNRMIQHDAPLSVWRGFRGSDFDQLRATPGLDGLRYGWRPFFRYLVIVPRDERRPG